MEENKTEHEKFSKQKGPNEGTSTGSLKELKRYILIKKGVISIALAQIKYQKGARSKICGCHSPLRIRSVRRERLVAFANHE